MEWFRRNSLLKTRNFTGDARLINFFATQQFRSFDIKESLEFINTICHAYARLISAMNRTSKSGCDGQHVISSAGMLKLR